MKTWLCSERGRAARKCWPWHGSALSRGLRVLGVAGGHARGSPGNFCFVPPHPRQKTLHLRSDEHIFKFLKAKFGFGATRYDRTQRLRVSSPHICLLFSMKSAGTLTPEAPRCLQVSFQARFEGKAGYLSRFELSTFLPVCSLETSTQTCICARKRSASCL